MITFQKNKKTYIFNNRNIKRETVNGKKEKPVTNLGF